MIKRYNQFINEGKLSDYDENTKILTRRGDVEFDPKFSEDKYYPYEEIERGIRKNYLKLDVKIDPYGEETWEVEKSKHYECCPKHGCIYDEPYCPVATKKAVPAWWLTNAYSNPCKYCLGEEWR